MNRGHRCLTAAAYLLAPATAALLLNCNAEITYPSNYASLVVKKYFFVKNYYIEFGNLELFLYLCIDETAGIRQKKCSYNSIIRQKKCTH